MAHVPRTSGKARVRLCSAQSPLGGCARGVGGCRGPGDPLHPSPPGPVPQGNWWAPLLERGCRITRKKSRTESSRTSALGLHC